jgi:hypothetical protein
MKALVEREPFCFRAERSRRPSVLILTIVHGDSAEDCDLSYSVFPDTARQTTFSASKPVMR